MLNKNIAIFVLGLRISAVNFPADLRLNLPSVKSLIFCYTIEVSLRSITVYWSKKFHVIQEFYSAH